MEHKLMIVDDDPYILIAIRELFEPENCEVYTVSKGQDCIEELKRGFKGVILMDLMMPHMDGWDTVQAIVDQGLHEGNIISMFTAKDMPDEKMDSMKDYIVDYLTKPFDPEELVDKIKKYFMMDT